MRTLWIKSSTKIGSRTAIQLGEGGETCLSSKYGEIWESGPGKYKAIVIRDSRGVRSVNEQLVAFGEVELEAWISKLQIPENPEEQTPHANGFSRL